jgi:hypothetical protein
MIRSCLLTAVVFTVFICASSCSVNHDNTNPQQGSFLTANISPDASPVNLSINSKAFQQGLPYGVYSPYYSTIAGNYTIDVTDANNTTLLSNTITLDVNRLYSYILIDSFKNLKAAFIQDNFNIPQADSIYIRFFNFSPNSQPLTLYDSAHSSTIYSTRNFNDQSYESDFANFIEMPAGNYTFQLKQPDGSVIASKQLELDGGHVYSLFAKGFVGGTDTQAIGIGQIVHY